MTALALKLSPSFRLSDALRAFLSGIMLMALTLETALRNALADAIDTEINTGAGTATLEFETSGDAEVATIDLQNPAFGAAAAGVITLAGTPLQDSSATGGTTAQFSIYDRDATKQLEGTVATSGADINITSVAIAATEVVTLSSFTITVPAS